jgi:beta-galactosidase
VLASWQSRHLAGTCAISLATLGRGKVVYVGTYLTEELTDALLPLLTQMAETSPPVAALPTGVELVRRQSEERTLWFFINHNEIPVTIREAPSGHNLVSDLPTQGPLTLNAWDVAVVETAL